MAFLRNWLLSTLIISCLGMGNLHAQDVFVSPNYHSAAIQVSNPSAWDTDTNGYCKILYRKRGTLEWMHSISPDRIHFDGITDFRVSLFGLEENTQYSVKASLHDSLPSPDSIIVSEFSFTTKTNPSFKTQGKTYWVNAAGQYSDYTKSKPGDLKTLLRSGLACGTTVIVMDDTYQIGDLTLNLTSSCTESDPIIIKADQGAKPLFIGSTQNKVTWTQSPSDTFLYSATLPSDASYTNLMLVNGKRMYPYSTLGNNIFLGNYNLSSLNFGFDGFCRDASSIYFKSSSGINPNKENVVLSNQFRALTVQGNGNEVYLRIKGIHFLHYAKSKVDLSAAYNAQTLVFRNCHKVVVDSCEFLFNDNPIVFYGGCSDVTVQHCNFKDNVGDWSHAMIKKSFANQTAIYPTSRGRSLENSSIAYHYGASNSTSIVYRYNTIQGSGDGIAFKAGPKGIYNVDFYENTVRRCFDGVEFDGLFSNLKVWKNVVDSNVASISIAPPRFGPSYFYRNEVKNIISRQNTSDDTYFVRCVPPVEYISQGVGIKTNVGGLTTDGAVLHFINNTFHSRDTNAFVQYLWASEWNAIHFVTISSTE